jgi:hypothetical protein
VQASQLLNDKGLNIVWVRVIHTPSEVTVDPRDRIPVGVCDDVAHCLFDQISVG